MALKEFREIAKKVRDAIIVASRAERHISFDDFPRGSCRDASRILGTYLGEHGFGKWELVSGEKGVRRQSIWDHLSYFLRDTFLPILSPV